MKLLATALLGLTPALADRPTDFSTIRFDSEDGLRITADLYAPHADKRAPLIVLFHQARWSRGEYRPIAPRLNDLGYNCLAVDLRSGGAVKGVPNETLGEAIAAGIGITYVDALPDVIMALKVARERHADGPVLAWGSSYSAALVLKVAGDHPELVDGVLSFAPGEYFADAGKPKDWIQSSARSIRCPTFVTSAKAEKSAWWPIYEAIEGEQKAFYLPETNGNHGSRALWGEFSDNKGYWAAVEAFLGDNFPPPADADGDEGEQ